MTGKQTTASMQLQLKAAGISINTHSVHLGVGCRSQSCDKLSLPSDYRSRTNAAKGPGYRSLTLKAHGAGKRLPSDYRSRTNAAKGPGYRSLTLKAHGAGKH